MWLPAEFLAKYHAKNASRRSGAYCGSRQSQGAEGVVLCPCLGEVHKGILIMGKTMPMLSCSLQAPFMDHLQCSEVLFCHFAIGRGIHMVDKASF